jgi:2-oxo-4-hydroxy-4-carboxy-5-ureidoimidazoline decarboxylase
MMCHPERSAAESKDLHFARTKICFAGLTTMNKVLTRWNALDPITAASEILPCCGSQAWAEALTDARPIADELTLFESSTKIWRALPEAAWQQAFDSHPRIGQQHAQRATEQSLRWSAQEQSKAATTDATKQALEEANLRYEQKFHRIFIVCATGKSTAKILDILESRMTNDAATELREAAEQQRQITELRLHRWLESQ